MKRILKRSQTREIPVKTCDQREYTYKIYIHKRFFDYEHVGEITFETDAKDVAMEIITQIMTQILESDKKYYDNTQYNLSDIKAIETESNKVLNFSIPIAFTVNNDFSNVKIISNKEALSRKNILIPS